MTAPFLRAFTPSGIAAFRDLLEEVRRGRTDPPEEGLLVHTAWTRALPGPIPFEPGPWRNRLDAARDLSSLLERARQSGFDMQSPGLWAWLSMARFDSVCPAGPDGRRAPGRDYRHIPERDARYGHRHLLKGACEVHMLHGGRADHLLLGAVSTESALFHEIASRHDLISNPSVIELTRLLYYDERKGHIKSGAQSGLDKPGSVRRLVSILMQFDLTYDLHGMDAMQILQLLPSEEFGPWLKMKERA